MSSSAGLLTPRGPFSGAAPLALRPLSAIAATAAGGVPEARIKRLLSDLLPSLMSLHAQGEICGDISLDTVGMDEGARAHLLPELVVARSRRNSCRPRPDSRRSNCMPTRLSGRAGPGPTCMGCAR